MPEFRKDPLVGRWVVFAPERKRRPVELTPGSSPLAPVDAFAAGNERFTPPEVYARRDPATAPNTPGWRVRVVPNRFPALRIEGDVNPEAVGFYDKMNGIGAHEVVIETPEAGIALEDQTLEGISDVIAAYKARMLDLLQDPRFRYLLIFKNVGPLAGASIAHAHSQIIAMPVVPMLVKEKLQSAEAYFELKDRNIFADIFRTESKSGERVVYENASFLVFCPFASRFPFELCVLPRRQCADFQNIEEHEILLLADALQHSLRKLASALGRPDFNMIIHTAPVRRSRKAGSWATLDLDFRWHIEILPRLSGIAGFEFGTGFFINTTLPEEAAAFLRQVKL